MISIKAQSAYRIALALFLASVLVLVLFPVSRANALSISPLTFELIGNPGEKINNSLRITNDTDSPVAISIDVEDFVAVGEEGQVTLEELSENAAYSLAKWVTVVPSTLELDARGSGVVDFVVNLPPDAEPGGHYASVLATVSGAAANGGVGVSQKVGALVLMNVSGDVKERVNIAEFSAPNYSEYGPVTLVTRFENTGTIHLKPRGFILIKNFLGREIGRIDLPQRNVLPRSIRKINSEWGDRIMFGRYEATLTAIYGTTNEPLAAVTSFWIVPWKVVGSIALGLIILLIFLIRGRRRIKLALRILFKGGPEVTGG